MKDNIRIFEPSQYGDIKGIVQTNDWMGFAYAMEYGDRLKIGSTKKPYDFVKATERQARHNGISTGRFAITAEHTNYRENGKALTDMYADKKDTENGMFTVSFDDAVGSLSSLALNDESERKENERDSLTKGLQDFTLGKTPGINIRKDNPENNKTMEGTQIFAGAGGISPTDIVTVDNVKGFVDKNQTVWLNAEAVARGLGFTTVAKSGNAVVRWARVNEYLADYGFSQQVGKNSFIPENMVYRLGFKANNEVARAFQAKLADEILPSIRKYGSYSANIPRTLPQALRLAAEQAEQIEQQQAQIAQQQKEVLQLTAKVTELKPKADYCDLILASDTAVTVSQIAADYNMSAKAMNLKLHDIGIQWKVGEQWILYTEYMDKGYTRSETIHFKDSNGREHTKMMTKWTQKGRLFLYDKLKAANVLPLMEQK